MCLLTNKQAHTLTATLFTIISVLHLTRVAKGWDAVIAGWQVPMWVSWVAIVVAGYLAYHFWYVASGRKNPKG